MKDTNIEWAAMLDDLENHYTLSIRDICNKLKSPRGWVNTYITPRLTDKIILPSGRGKNAKKGVNWAYVAGAMLGRRITEMIWYRESDFYELLKTSVKKVSRQTYRIPCEFVVKDVKEYSDKFLQLSKELADLRTTTAIPINQKFVKAMRLERQRTDLWREYLKDELKPIIDEGECSNTGRSKVKPIPVEYDVVSQLDRWIAPHDIKEYGDTDEIMFRTFFRDAYYRIELGFESKDGRQGRKVFYLFDEEMPKHQYVDQYVTLRYDIWLCYKDEIMKGLPVTDS